MTETETRKPDRRLPALLAAVGLLFSAALEVVHFRAYVSPSASSFCTAGPKLDCGVVALSRWSVVLGIPVPLWGVAGFMAMTLLAWWGSRWIMPLAVMAALTSAALLGIELFAIHNVCLLCEGVHVASWALLAVVWRSRHTFTAIDGITVLHLLTVPVGVLVIAHTLLTPYWVFFSWKDGVQFPHGTDAEGHPWIGAESPRVVLHEYTDYFCPHCAVAANQTRRLLAEHPSLLRIVHHNYPRMMHCGVEAGKVACLFARAANCAGDQGKFWEMDSWLFAHAPGQVTLDFLVAARDVGLDSAKLFACIDSRAAFERADAEAVAASHARVINAPSFVIDGKLYVGAAVFPELDRRLAYDLRGRL